MIFMRLALKVWVFWVMKVGENFWERRGESDWRGIVVDCGC